MSELFICPHGLGYRNCKNAVCLALIVERDKDCADAGQHVERIYQHKTIDPEYIEEVHMCLHCKKEL